MKKQKEFSIPFSGLKQGKHDFEYTIGNEFFESFGYDEFNGAEIQLNVELKKLSNMLEFLMNANGLLLLEKIHGDYRSAEQNTE